MIRSSLLKSAPSLAMALALGLSGCVSILPEPAPAPAVYRLAASNITAESRADAEIIRVDRPSAPTIFQSKDIVVATNGSRLSAVAQANWAETMPILIQGALIDAMAGSDSIVPILPASGARSNTRIHLTVKHFEADFDQGQQSPPLAIVSYRVTYANASDRELLGTYTVRKTQRAGSINVSSIVDAIETANREAMTDIVTWLEATKAS